jgi:transposase
MTLANILRTDQHVHRRLPADTHRAQAIAVLARALQDATWRRTRASNELRSLLREYFPESLEAFAGKMASNLASADTRAVLAIAAALRRGGHQRRIDTTAAQLHAALREPQLRQPDLVEHALGRQALALLAVLDTECRNVDELGQATAEAFHQHPDHAIITSFPGLADNTGARVLAELGDDRTRFTDARAVKIYAGSAPITRASGRTISITHRRVKNDRLAAAGWAWAFRRDGSRRTRPPPLPTSTRPRRPAPSRATPPVQPDARPALPLPPNRPVLPPRPGIYCNASPLLTERFTGPWHLLRLSMTWRCLWPSMRPRDSGRPHQQGDDAPHTRADQRTAKKATHHRAHTAGHERSDQQKPARIPAPTQITQPLTQ